MSNANVDNELGTDIIELKQRFQEFINEEVIPAEPILDAGGDESDQVMTKLKARAKELGLWALGHPTEIGGGGLPFMAFVHINEVIGRSHYCQYAVGSISMQDSIMLHLYGTEAQQAQWLKPLVDGDISFPDNHGELGLLSERDVLQYYCELTGRERIEHWTFYIIFSLFRSAAILQGVYKRGLDGNASSDRWQDMGPSGRAAADRGWQLVLQKCS